MSKISQFDNPTCRLVGDRVEKALAALGDELGVKIAARGGTYSGGTYTLKLEINVVGADGSVASRYSEAFKQLATLYGLKIDDLGRTFRANGKEYKIVGLNPKGRTRPVVVQDTRSGKEYVFTVADVRIFTMRTADGKEG